jgi:hypothetical protein
VPEEKIIYICCEFVGLDEETVPDARYIYQKRKKPLFTNSKLHSKYVGITRYQDALNSGIQRGVGVNPPPKFRSFDKAEPNSQFRGKYIYNNLIRIRGSLILKLSETPG